MLPGYLLGLREGLEAALILGITFGVLRRMRRSELAPAAWQGVAVAVAISILAALALFVVGARLEGRAEQVVEGVTMILAAGILTWMILWMSVHGRQVQLGLERDVTEAALRRQASAIFVVAFIAVLREGIETALFLTRPPFRPTGGGRMGVWRDRHRRSRLGPLSSNDPLSFGLLPGDRVAALLFAAGLFAHGVHEFVEAGLLPALIDPVWNSEAILSEASPLGVLLRTLFGYNADPTLLEALAYIAYFAAVVVAQRAMGRRRPTAAVATS
jgi:high-affinity iron transporter